MPPVLISIIIPVYDSERYLERCLDSIAMQDLSQAEVIIINDGSKDNSGTICKNFARKNNNFIYISQPNQGVSATRNRGLEIARGEWILFVDSDDFLLPDFIIKCKQQISDNFDIIFFSWIYQNKKGIQQKGEIFTDKIFPLRNINEAFKNTNIILTGTPWGKLFKKQIIKKHNIIFDTSLQISEDRLFLYRFLTFTKGIRTSSLLSYCYQQTNYGLSSKKHNIYLLVRRFKKLSFAAKAIKIKFNLTPDAYLPFVLFSYKYIEEIIYYYFRKDKNPITRFIITIKIAKRFGNYRAENNNQKLQNRHVCLINFKASKALIKKNYFLFTITSYHILKHLKDLNKIFFAHFKTLKTF